MELRTEAYPHDFKGSVTCDVCGKEYQVDHASVKLISRRCGILALRLCDDCATNAPATVSKVLRKIAENNRQGAEEARREAEQAEKAALAYEQAAENPEGTWASLEDLEAARQAAKEYLAKVDPPKPKGWTRHYGEIPF
jgi:hypothetical protein